MLCYSRCAAMFVLEGHSIMDMDTDEIMIQRIVGVPWNDPGTDVEDELPTPVSSPAQCEIRLVVTGDSVIQTEHEDNFDLDLAKVLLDVSVMPMMTSPIQDPIVTYITPTADYIAPDIPTVSTDARTPELALPQETVTTNSWCQQYSPISMASSEGGGTSDRRCQCCPRHNHRLLYSFCHHAVKRRWTSTCRKCRRHWGSRRTLPCNRTSVWSQRRT